MMFVSEWEEIEIRCFDFSLRDRGVGKNLPIVDECKDIGLWKYFKRGKEHLLRAAKGGKRIDD